MNKHTTGPWTIIEKPNGTLGIGAHEPDGEECRPAQINGNAVEEPYASVTWANARLIAAAPDLLRELQAMLEENYMPGSGHKRAVGARAAIAKALGGQ